LGIATVDTKVGKLAQTLRAHKNVFLERRRSRMTCAKASRKVMHEAGREMPSFVAGLKVEQSTLQFCRLDPVSTPPTRFVICIAGQLHAGGFTQLRHRSSLQDDKSVPADLLAPTFCVIYPRNNRDVSMR
jgi:hypothetical protein